MAIDQSSPEYKRRQEIEKIFEDVLGEYSDHVYFEPPENCKIEYPCIIYEISNGNTRFASNDAYMFNFRYIAKLIDKDPDSDYAWKLAKHPFISFDRGYVADNLYHKVFTVY